MLAALRLNQVRLVPTSSGDVILKRRFHHAKAIIPLGNLYLRMAGIPVRVLSNDAWISRETSVYQDVHAIRLTVDSHGWLCIPKAPGTVLTSLLASSAPKQLKIAAFVSAMQALSRLHDHRISHGDATVENVAYDPETSEAQWFDFDTEHHGIDWATRRADDLRAVLFSAANRVAPEDIDSFVVASMDSWNDAASLMRFGALIKAPGLRYNLFHLAQMKGNLNAHDHTVQSLQSKLA